MTAFRGMHVSPAKHSYASVTDGQTDRRTDDGQSDPYVSLCFAGDTKSTCAFDDRLNMLVFEEYTLLRMFRDFVIILLYL